MAKYQDSVEILIQARNTAKAELEQARLDIKKVADESGSAANKMALSSLKQIAAITAIARGVSQFTHGLVEAKNAGLSLGETLTSSFDKMIKSLPILSDAARFGENIRELITGERAKEQAAIEKSIEFEREMTRTIEKQLDVIFARKKLLEDTQKDRAKIALETAMFNAPDDATRAIIAANAASNDRVKAASDALTEQQTRDRIGKTGESEATRELRKRLSEVIDIEWAKVGKALDAKRDAQVDKSLASFFDQVKTESDADVAAAEQHRQLMAGVDADIEQIRLRSAGRILDADLAAIRTASEERIRAAQKDGDYVLAERLKVLQSVEEADARAEDRKRRDVEDKKQLDKLRDRLKPGELPTLNQDRFLTGVRDQTLSEDRKRSDAAVKQLETSQQIKRATEEAKELLQTIADAIKSGPRILGSLGLK